MNLTPARVVAINPKSNSVDVVVLADGRRLPGVKLLSGSGGSDFGMSDLSEPTETGYEAGNSGKRDVTALIAWAAGVPVVMGFMRPTNNQMSFDEKGRMVYRHGSDVYITIDKDGSTELAHPSGAHIRIAENPDHEDLSGKDFNQKWAIERNTDKQVSIRVGLGAFALTINPEGHLAIEAQGVTITSDVVIDGNLQVHGTIDADGVISSQEDVLADGISGKTHVHGKVQAGSAKSDKPE